MDSVNPQSLQVFPSEGREDHLQMPIQIDDDEGGYEADDVGGDETMDDIDDVQVNLRNHGNHNLALASRTSELTLSFEGEVYVFHAVTPEKVQAVLLLLGERDIPTGVPHVEVSFHQNNRGVVDGPRHSNLSRRIASLVRFREKRKERCFEKKIRYTVRKEVAQKMHRKNGQFASVKESFKEGLSSAASWDPAQSCLQDNGTPRPTPVLRKCQHCGISENCTPAMRRGPAGPRSLCNACGLMWANKGTLRDLSKGGRHISFDQSELETSGDIKPLAIELENPSANQDEQGSLEETKPFLVETRNPVIGQDEQGTAQNLSNHMGMENSSANSDEEENFDDFTNASTAGIEIPDNPDDQLGSDDQGYDIASHGP